MNDYFGLLHPTKVKGLTAEGLGEFMIESELFYVSNSFPLDLIGAEIRHKKSEIATNIKPSNDLVYSFYEFLKTTFSIEIERPFLNYFSEFEETVFGLDIPSQRAIAIKDFKNYYNKVKGLKGNLLRKEKSDNGIEQVTPINRFDFLKGRQLAIKNQVANIEKGYLNAYLEGDKSFFKKDTLLKLKDFKDLIEFESVLKILISLNGKFEFEEDYQFSELGLLKELFEMYTHIFHKKEVFIYAHKKIQSFNKNKPTNIGSLYDALIHFGLIDRNKANFIKYVAIEHKIKLSSIKYFERGQNLEHDLRVKKIKQELLKYAEEK